MIGRLSKGVMLAVLLFSLLSACSAGDYRITNVKIYQNTPAWELAKAVNNQDTKKIADIAEKKPEALDYQDPKYGTTLLFWAVGMEKYDSAEALLKAGADPNIISTYEGGTALYRAAGFSLVDTQAKKDPQFVKLLLEYGADPNIGFVGNDHNNSTEIGTTPLMNSIGCGIEKTKALVEAGADIDIKVPDGRTAAVKALGGGGYTTHVDATRYAYYLIVEKRASVSDAYYYRANRNQPIDEGSPMYPVDALRYWVFDLDSEGHQMKMEIVDEFARQGIDYWETDIPSKYVLEYIQALYPDTWEEYIKRY